MVNTIQITGTGGIIEGNLGTANVNVNLDSVLEFDGVNDKITVPDDNTLDIVGDITLSAWVKITMGEADFKTIISKAPTLNNNKSPWQLRIDDSDKVEFVTGDGSNQNRQSSTNAIKEGWNHIAVTVDENGTTSVCKYFINGVLDRTISTGWTDYSGFTNTDDLLIGVLGTGYFHDGYLADVRIYNAVVSEPDVAILASKINIDPSFTTAGTTNLQGWWKLTNNDVTDSSPNTNNGTASGPTERFDQFYVDVYSGSFDSFTATTTTDGDFTVSQGKLECKALTAADFAPGTSDGKITIASGPALTDTHTLAIWARHDDTGGAQTYFGWGSAQYFDIQNSLDDLFYRVGSQHVTVDISDGFGTALTTNRWYHIAAVRSGTTVTFYVNGENIGSATNASMTGTDTLETIGAEFAGDDAYGMAGKLRDARVYLHALSDKQVASLYAGSLIQTPDHWWKIDEGTGGNGDPIEDYGTATDADGVLAPAGYAPNWSNGPLDLDGKLTISADGAVSAPRGTLQLSDDFTISADTATFTHNNGTVEILGNVELLPIDYDSSENERHIFYNVTHGSGTWYIERPTIIEKSYTKTGGDTRQYTKTTFGTATSEGTMTINSGAWVFYGYYGSPTLQGANQLYPLVVTGSGYTADGPIDWDAINNESRSPDTFNYIKWIDFTKDMVTGGNGGDAVLTGDVKFAGLTISSGDSINLNGKRAQFTGTLTGAGELLCGTDGFIETSGLINFDNIGTWTGNCNIITTTSQNHYLKPSSVAAHNLTNLFIRNGANAQRWQENFVQSLIVGGGTNSFGDPPPTTGPIENITVANGGELSCGDRNIHLDGDFTMSGGLLGPSCLSLDRDNTEYARSVEHADFDLPASRNAMTVEMWFKTGYTGSNHQHMMNLKDNDGSPQVMQMYIDHSTGKINTRIFTSGTTSSLIGASDVRDNKWHHVANVYDGDTGEHSLYVDGKLEATETGTGGIYLATNCEFNIGVRYSLDQGYFEGEIDEVRMFAAAKTEEQIRADMFKPEGTNLTHFNSQATSGSDGLVGRWHCNDGQGSTLTCSNTNLNMTIKDHAAGPAAYDDAWADASSLFSASSSTITMAGGTQTIAYTHQDGDFHSLTINAGSTTQLLSVGQSGLNALQDINENLTVNGVLKSHPDTSNARLRLRDPNATFAVDSSVKATALADLAQLIVDGNGTFDFPEFTTKVLNQTSSGTTVALTGPLTLTEELDLASGTTFNSKGHNFTTKLIDLHSGGTLNIEKNSSLIFSDVSGAGFGSSDGTFKSKGAAAASFDGTDDKMEDTSNPLPGSGPFTFTMFFRTSTAGTRQGLVDFTASSSRGMLDVMADNKLLLYLGSNNYRYWDPITSYLDGEWHHIAVYVPGYAQADIASITVHIDGNLINPSATLQSGPAQQPVMADLKLGCGYTGNNAWTGDLADARIFEKALTADNLTTLRSVNPSKANATSYSDASNVIEATHWWKLNESNFPTDNAADSVGSIALSVTGAVPNRITITSSAGGNPSNYWNFHDHSMAQTVHYTTLEKFHRYESGSAAIEYDNNTMQTTVSGYYNWTIEGGATINSFTNNTINVTGNYGFQCNKTHTAFDNITVTSSGDYSVISTGGRLEFTNSNFSIGNVRLSNSSSHLISSAHNDTEYLYEICAGSGGLTYSAISNKPDIPNGVLKQRTGLFLFNSDNKEFNTLEVFSGATIRVSDTKDMYLTTFDNDGTWDQSTAGYRTGEIHVGDFTPFDSGDILDDTDFVDTGFHDTSHYLEMDL